MTCVHSGGRAFGISGGECRDESAVGKRRLESEEIEEEGKVRRRRGRRLLMLRLLLLLGRLFYGLLLCCFLRCHENFTPLRCEHVD